MEHWLEIEDRYYILADSPLADQRTLVLKHEDLFAVFNAAGDIEPVGHNAQGIYLHDMRHLSRWQIRLNGLQPIVLSARVTNDNSRIIVDLTNPDFTDGQHVVLPRGTLHVSRTRFLSHDRCHEQFAVSNFGLESVSFELTMSFAADFADLFEIRGMPRQRRGLDLPVSAHEHGLTLGYIGLDHIKRQTHIECVTTPDEVRDREIVFQGELGPRGRTVYQLKVHCETSEEHHQHVRSASRSGDAALLLQRGARCSDDDGRRLCRVESSNVQFNAWLRRSYADLGMLMTTTERGLYPYAGVPWYSAPFGRDGIITALQMIWINPSVARGVLDYLAHTQATEDDPSRDAEPGKILHECRRDEMSRLGEVPFGKYYGSVDATPLFVILADAYHRVTGDLEFIASLWPNIERAIDWINTFGDIDGDGFIDYQCRSRNGLGNQGWKDSQDSVFHDDGELAMPPIALCEVQAYAFQAKECAARLARILGQDATASALEDQARSSKQQFNQSFWLEDLGTYALALDGRKRPCRVKTSNAGHCLFSGIAQPEMAQQLARNLLARDMYSGWGIRTVSSTEARYNPMAYHNGSLWPHDNALIAQGLAAYGYGDEALRVFKGWFDASTYFDLHRLPELCCGFRRRLGKGPTLYPVACSPQAWAAGAPFMLLGACLGMVIDGVGKRVHLSRPQLPSMIENVTLHDLQVGNSSIDLYFHREKGDVGVLVTRRDDAVEVLVSK